MTFRHNQTIRRVLRLDLGFHAFAPVYESLLVGGTEPGVVMDPGIAVQWHIPLLQLLYTIIHLFVLIGDTPSRKFIEVEMPLPFLDMITQPPADGLDFCIPGIDSLVGMTVRTGCCEDLVNVGRYGI